MNAITRRQALKRKLHWNGTYYHNKDIVIKNKDTIQKEYPKASIYLVREDSGYAIYVDKIYDAYHALANYEAIHNNEWIESYHKKYIQSLRDELELKIFDLNEDHIKLICALNKQRKIIEKA
jgi:hypothetical protein